MPGLKRLNLGGPAGLSPLKVAVLEGKGVEPVDGPEEDANGEGAADGRGAKGAADGLGPQGGRKNSHAVWASENCRATGRQK